MTRAHRFDMSFEEGVRAFQASIPYENCPYVEAADVNGWKSGWVASKDFKTGKVDLVIGDKVSLVKLTGDEAFLPYKILDIEHGDEVLCSVKWPADCTPIKDKHWYMKDALIWAPAQP